MSLIADTRETDRIHALVEPVVAALDLEVVRVLIGGGEHPVLQIMLDRADGSAIDVEDCTLASRAISALLDVEDPIDGHYDLEVSSPGIDRPLTRPKDFERFAGFEARIELARAVDGRRRFRGKLMGLEAEQVRLQTDDQEVALPLAEIAKAKLVLTDELIARTGQA